MSKKVGNISIINAEKPQQCDGCGQVKELRPYGPNGSVICHDCGMKDPVGTQRRMAKILFGDEGPAVEAILKAKFGSRYYAPTD